jgi:hypothetical protein
MHMSCVCVATSCAFGVGMSCVRMRCVLHLVAHGVWTCHECVQAKVQGGLCSRPLLSVPHILADESSCYYHGYVLAEMSVHQTRDHFVEKLGGIVDNQQVSLRQTCVLTSAALPCCCSCCCAVAVGILRRWRPWWP